MEVTTVSHAGIANRIKNILSAMSQYDKVSTLYETINFIFPSIPKVDNAVNAFPEDWRLYVDPEEEKFIENYKTIDLMYENTPQYFVDKYLNIIKSIEINQDILDFVDEFTENWNDMHNNSIFESEIDRLGNKKFFFCSDNSDVQKYFIDKYGDRVITYDRQIFNNPQLAESGHHDDIQITTDAFIELLILSKCATIVGTYASSFDEVAWWMSGCKSKVIIPTPINCEKEYNDFNDLIYVKK